MHDCFVLIFMSSAERNLTVIISTMPFFMHVIHRKNAFIAVNHLSPAALHHHLLGMIKQSIKSTNCWKPLETTFFLKWYPIITFPRLQIFFCPICIKLKLQVAMLENQISNSRLSCCYHSLFSYHLSLSFPLFISLCHWFTLTAKISRLACLILSCDPF